ncbi:hypothetical protein JXA88_06470 [Candidatus Fermentibacteria bacterium]|nr:hypothetical protein [Candidatus Fermentibacteria bacterium]
MRWTVFVAIALALPCMAAEWWEEELQAQEAVEEGTPVQACAGKVLWTQGFIEVVGEAACDMDEALSEGHCYVMARRAAIVLAQEKLSETVNGIVVDGETLLRNELLSSSTLRTTMRGLVKGAQVVHEDRVTLPDGSILARVWMQLPLRGEGGLAAPILEHAAQLSAQRPVPAFSFDKAPPAEPFTGIIVNASGLQAVPAMAPRLLVLKELTAALSVEHVELATAQEIGLVEYAGSVDDARALGARIGSNPLVLKAESSHGATKSDLVISAQEGTRLAAGDPEGTLVRACKVVFAGHQFI